MRSGRNVVLVLFVLILSAGLLDTLLLAERSIDANRILSRIHSSENVGCSSGLGADAWIIDDQRELGLKKRERTRRSKCSFNQSIDGIVLHSTMSSRRSTILHALANGYVSGAQAHYYIDRTPYQLRVSPTEIVLPVGHSTTIQAEPRTKVYRLVAEDYIANHFTTREPSRYSNSTTIGIELFQRASRSGKQLRGYVFVAPNVYIRLDESTPYTVEQILTLRELLRGIRQRYGSLLPIYYHSEVQSDQAKFKVDPYRFVDESREELGSCREPRAAFPEVNISWDSADSSIATVDNGLVTGLRPGQTNLIVRYTTDDGTELSTLVPATVIDGTLPTPPSGDPQGCLASASVPVPLVAPMCSWKQQGWDRIHCLGCGDEEVDLPLEPEDEVFVSLNLQNGCLRCMADSSISGMLATWRIKDYKGRQMNWNGVFVDSARKVFPWDRGSVGKDGHPVSIEIQRVSGGELCWELDARIDRRWDWNVAGWDLATAPEIAPLSYWCGSINEAPCGGGSGDGSGLECEPTDLPASINPTWRVTLDAGDQVEVSLAFFTLVYGGANVRLVLLDSSGNVVDELGWWNVDGEITANRTYIHSLPQGQYYFSLDARIHPPSTNAFPDQDSGRDLWEYGIAFAVRRASCP